jgi:hypothetical protein
MVRHTHGRVTPRRRFAGMARAAGGGEGGGAMGDVGSARLTVDGEERPADRGAPRRGNDGTIGRRLGSAAVGVGGSRGTMERPPASG